MTEQKALELLDLEPGASASEIRRAYQEIYNELQIRLTNAPTEHQKELYRKRLTAVEEAYLFLGGQSEEDLSELPSMGLVETASEEKAQASKPQPITEAAALELLGLGQSFSRGRLLDAYKEKKADFEKGLQVAPNKDVKQVFQKSLNDLELAFSLLSPLAYTPPPKIDSTIQTSSDNKVFPLIWSVPVLIIIIGVWFFWPKGEKVAEINQDLRDEFIKVKGQADLLAEKQYWDQALEKYEEAYALMADIEVMDSIVNIKQRLAAIDAEANDWAAAQRISSPTGYMDFIKKYPMSPHKSQAEQKIRDLEVDRKRIIEAQSQLRQSPEEQKRMQQANLEAQNKVDNDRRIAEEIERKRKDEESKKIYDEPDIAPTFQGGLASFSQYLSNNLVYPEAARRIGIEGTVYIEFIVDVDGAIQDVRLLRGIGGGCDEEAIRVIQKSPKWSPGIYNGNRVKTRMRLPISFRLN